MSAPLFCEACTGTEITIEIRASLDGADLHGCAYTLTASGTAEAYLVGRDADPTAANGLTYISRTSYQPLFDNNLPIDLAAGTSEVLMDMSGSGVPAGPDVLLETLTVLVTGTGDLTLTLSDASASTMDGPAPVLFDTVTIDPTGEQFVTDVLADGCERILHVDADAADGGSGESWADPYNHLSDALDEAAGDCSVVEIWVAQGTYMPDGGDRNASFELVDGVAVYGGFPTGGGDGTFEARLAWPFIYTTLSGEIGSDLITSDNSYHVVTADATVTATGVLDGVAIAYGAANSFGGVGGGIHCLGSPTLVDCWIHDNASNGDGAGMYNEGDPMLVGCRFTGNTAYSDGGGMANSGDATLVNCRFVLNGAGDAAGSMLLGGGAAASLSSVVVMSMGGGGNDGGGLYTESGTVALTNCVFDRNYADKDGGGIKADSGTVSLTNCTLVRNEADVDGGGLAADWYASVTIASCILWDNWADGDLHQIDGSVPVTYSCVEEGWPGVGNIGDDPGFVDLNNGYVSLDECSPCIDSGNNDTVPADVADLDGDEDTTEPTPLDYERLTRFLDDTGSPDCPHVTPPDNCGTAPIVDMGAYEFQDASVCD